MPLLFILEKLNVQLLFGQKGCFRLNSLLPLSNRHTYYRIKTIYRIYYIYLQHGKVATVMQACQTLHQLTRENREKQIQTGWYHTLLESCLFLGIFYDAVYFTVQCC